MQVPTFKLSNDILIPKLHFGTFRIQDEAVAVHATLEALNVGYRAIDTAAGYDNEKGVGKAIAASGLKREDIFVTTKLRNPDQGYDSTMRAFDVSMKKLGLDYLDLYLIHWPSKNDYIPSWKAFEVLYKEGRIRAIGVSNFMPEHLDRLANETDLSPAVNQFEVHPYLWQKKTIDYCRAHNIVIEAYAPLMTGGEVLQDATVLALAKKYAKTPAQIILNWLNCEDIVVIAKSTTDSRILENSQIFDFKLDKEDMAKMQALECGRRIYPDPYEMVENPLF